MRWGIWDSYLLVVSRGSVRVIKEKFVLGKHTLYIFWGFFGS
jgi:hypothetical protein